MARSVYITAFEPQSGKSIVALGFIELLCARAQRVGYFRPVAREDGGPDPHIELIRRRYRLETTYDEMRGVSGGEARAALEAGDHGGLEQRLLAAYRRLEPRCDVIVCEGVDVAASTPTLGFELDARLANQAGCPVLAVIRGRSAAEVPGQVRRALEAVERSGCESLGVIVNRVPAPLVAAVAERLASEPIAPPAYVLREQPELTIPTVGEVASALGADRAVAADGGFDREVHGITVGAMSVEHMLEDLATGTLLLVPGDRPDILVAAALSALAPDVPSVAGIILTGGYALSPTVRRLLDGAPFAVLEVSGTTEEATRSLDALSPRLRVDDERHIAAALGVFQAGVDPLELEERIALERPVRLTPAMFDHELLERAREARQRIVLPEGDDDRVLRAGDILLRRGVVDLTILGDAARIRARADALGLDLDEARLEDPLSSPRRAAYAARYHELRRHKGLTEEMAFDAVGGVNYFGTLAVECGDVDGMVCGAVHTTADTVRPAFEVIRARPGVSTVSSVFFMCLPDRVLVYGDCAVNPNPDTGQLADIAISSAETALSFGIEPRIAMLSYSTGESGRGGDVDKVREATALVLERRPQIKVEGPIQYDAAVDPDVARLKLPGSAVAGQATVLVFPDLQSGNIAYKAVQRSGRATAVGPVLQGLRKPVNDLSRGCAVEDIVQTVVITAIQAQEASGSSTSRLRIRLPAA